MKNKIGKTLLAKRPRIFLGLALFFVLPCAAVPAAAIRDSKAAAFDDVTGRDWVLAELKSSGNTVRINRQRMEADGLNGFFTIGFEDGRLNGRGAPNLFNGPYSLAGDRGISFGPLASTMMMAMKEPDELSEREYFSLLGAVSRWELFEGRLELLTTAPDGAGLTLIFE